MAGDVGHVEAGHEEGGGEGEGADVFFYFGFAVEVEDVGEFAVGDCVGQKLGVSHCALILVKVDVVRVEGWM